MTKTTETAQKADVEITELAVIEPTRFDGVGTPANGFPVLMMKSLPAPASAAAPAVKDTGCGCGADCTCATKAAPAKAAKTPEQKAAKAAKKAAKKAALADRLAQETATDHTGGASGTNVSSTEKAATITPDVIAKAVAEATAPFEAELTTLREQMAKVLATPIPGGPQLVTPHTPRNTTSPAIQKAERLRAIANQTIDPETRVSYLELAAREEGASITKE